MSFQNPALAWGALAFAVPLVIHLLNRSRFRTVDWGATHLLAEVVRTNRRRFRLDQLLLLLVRCAIPALLAFCLAQPVWTGGFGGNGGGAAGDGPVSLALVLDDSRSMGAPGESGTTRFEEAKEAAKTLIAGAGKGSDLTIVRAGGPPVALTDAPTFDAAALAAALDPLEPVHGPADLPAAVEAALAALDGMSHADRELIVLSDFAPADFPTDAAAALGRRVAEADLPPNLALIPLPGAGGATDNLSVDGLETPARPAGVGRPVRLRATVRNHGAAERTVRATLTVDGAEAGVQSVSAPAGGTVGVLFVHTFETPGDHALAVAATPGGTLAADDVGRSVIRVLDRLPVLLVDGDPGRAPLSGETDFLSIALTPLSFGTADLEGGRAADLLETRTVRARELIADDFAGARLVVLANVARLEDEPLAALTEYVSNGGSLLVAAGDKIDLRWHRDRLYADGAGLLPRAWGGVAGGDDAPSRVLAERFDHPALEPFNDPANGDLSDADVRRWMTVEEPAENAGPGERGPGRVLARLNTADPLLILRPFGRGTVVQLTTAVDADWSDLPLRPAFVPLMQGLAASLATRPAPPAALRPGEPAVAVVPEGVDAVTARPPEGRRRAVAVTVEKDEAGAVRRLARFERTRRPGFYELNWPAQEQGDPGSARFAVTADPRESAAGVMEDAQLAALAEALGATRAESAAEYRARDDRRRHGRELWRWVLAGLLAALFLELVLQQRFSFVGGPR